MYQVRVVLRITATPHDHVQRLLFVNTITLCGHARATRPAFAPPRASAAHASNQMVIRMLCDFSIRRQARHAI